jgi:ABC-2 type transport system ATP-binding protein
MEEAERLCDRIVIIDHGKVIANDTVRGLYRRLPATGEVLLEFDGPPASDSVLAGLAALPGISAALRDPKGVCLETEDFGAPLALALEQIARLGIRVTSIRSGRVSLEDVFIALTGHALRDGAVAGATP